MQDIGPCGPSSQLLHAFIILVNAFQAVLIAWLANRARSKDVAEKRRNGHTTESR